MIEADFPPATEDAWRALVTKTLKDAPFESLQRTTAEGLAIEPLYAAGVADAGVPTRPFDVERPWDMRSLIAHPDPNEANRDLLRDLEGGCASAIIAVDPTGKAGVTIGSAEGMTRTLKGMVLEMAPLALDAGFLGPQAADWLHAVAKSSPGAKVAFHLDPLSAFAEAGVSPGPVESHLITAANTAVRMADIYPQAQLFLASGRVVHEAGGGEAAEVAFAAAAGVAYARALVRAGMPVAEAFSRITLGLSADVEYFQTIAKLRAARRVWARITAACGADPAARVEARSSNRMLTVKDAWTNMIRLTAAGFGAAVGGADSVALGAFTDAIGVATDFGRRQSRNTQLVLMEEAHLGRVADPAAGSGYIEAMTDEIARAAWADFQAIEAAGGAIAALESGLVETQTARGRDGRKPSKIVGVTAFPPENDTPVEVRTPTLRPVEAPSPRLPGPDSKCPALTPIRFAAAHEAA